MSGRPDVRTISSTLCSKNTSGVQRRFRKSFAAAVVIVAVVKRARLLFVRPARLPLGRPRPRFSRRFGRFCIFRWVFRPANSKRRRPKPCTPAGKSCPLFCPRVLTPAFRRRLAARAYGMTMHKKARIMQSHDPGFCLSGNFSTCCNGLPTYFYTDSPLWLLCLPLQKPCLFYFKHF